MIQGGQMQGAVKERRTVRFGTFEVNFEAGEVRKSGIRLKLQEQPFRVLTLLLERPGEILSREELQRKLWPEDTFVDFENSLNSAVARLRDVLGDSATTPRFIETVPRRGYRFVASVEGEPAAPAPESPGVRRIRWPWLAAATAAAVLATAAIWRYSPGLPEAQPELIPLTTYPGNEGSPTFSPDGNRVAFVWTGPNDDNFDIYVNVIGTDNPQLRTSHPARDVSPEFSPDGRWIAFVRETERGTGDVMLVPSVGGRECQGSRDLPVPPPCLLQNISARPDVAGSGRVSRRGGPAFRR